MFLCERECSSTKLMTLSGGSLMMVFGILTSIQIDGPSVSGRVRGLYRQTGWEDRRLE